jgi:putative endonuclease
MSSDTFIVSRLLVWNPFAPRRIHVSRLGQMGERRAAWFYRLRGYRVIGRNVRLAAGEIDLVARRGRTIVIVEVKTRQSFSAGEGHDAVTSAKRARLVRLADQFVTGLRERNLEIRYDILSLFWNGRRFVVSHYADAFRPVADVRQPWRWSV